jgi:succinate dehydrogenase hydrophobic anchor subunit
MNDDEIRARQRARARVTALILAAFAVLFFFVTIAKIRGLHP